MSEYQMHLAALLAIVLLGIQAAVIAVRNGAGWITMLALALPLWIAGLLADEYRLAFAWFDADAKQLQTQFFDQDWNEKVAAQLLRSWGYLFALGALPAGLYWRTPGKRRK